MYLATWQVSFRAVNKQKVPFGTRNVLSNDHKIRRQTDDRIIRLKNPITAAHANSDVASSNHNIKTLCSILKTDEMCETIEIDSSSTQIVIL